MLVLSVPLVGAGPAAGVTGATGPWPGRKFAVVCFFGAAFCADGFAAKLSNMLAHEKRKTAVRTRGLKIPDCDENFFRMGEVLRLLGCFEGYG